MAIDPSGTFLRMHLTQPNEASLSKDAFEEFLPIDFFALTIHFKIKRKCIDRFLHLIGGQISDANQLCKLRSSKPNLAKRASINFIPLEGKITGKI